MTRTLSGGQTEREGVEGVWLLEVVFWDGSSEVIHRLCTAADDLSADPDGTGAVTFTGAGDFLSWGGASETQETRAQGTRVKLSGVDTTIMSALLGNQFRGRRMRIWRARVEDGAVTDTHLVHRGVQLEAYKVEEKRPESEGQAPTAEITTRSVSRLTTLQRRNAVRTNVASHNAMLARAGESTGDSAFRYLPELERFFWGSEVPAAATDGTNSDSTAGSSGSGPGNDDRGGRPGPEVPFRP